MKTDSKLLKDYYGAAYFIEENQNKNLTVFIVDDDMIYLNTIRKKISNFNYSVYTFTSGEECIDYLSVKPDLVLLDYHLDGVNKYAQKGDIIYEKIKSELPNTEVVMMSSDKKFQFISNLNLLKTENVVFKGNSSSTELKSIVEAADIKKGTQNLIKTFQIISVIFIVMIISFFVYLYTG